MALKSVSLLGSGIKAASATSAPSEELFIPKSCDGKSLADLPVSRVHPDPNQPRVWNEAELDELQSKIEGAGKIIQPITVIPRVDMPGHYWIKTGEGRWRVAGRLNWEFIPAVIEDVRVNSDTRQVFAEQILENIGRVGMNPMAIARSIEKYMHDFGPTLTGKEAAVMLGINETKISRYRKLLTANEEIQEITSKITNINTLGYLIDLSREDEEIYKSCIDKMQKGELVNAERHLKNLVQKIKSPKKEKKILKEKEEPKKIELNDNHLNDGNGLGDDMPVVPPRIIENVWDDALLLSGESMMPVNDIFGVEVDGLAIIKLVKDDGEQFTFKLDYERQLKLQWLLNRCLDK